jgi:hypothetical protein
MTLYCSVCGDELDPEEELDGICESCKLNRRYGSDDEDDQGNSNF